MPDIASIIQSGVANPWLYLPLAVLLGALHALEPGHAKTLMAGFIVAVRGTPSQATLLGVSAAVGHTIVVWGLALLGLYLGDKLILERAEPWLVLMSGLLVMGLAFRIFWMLRRQHHHHHHVHDHHEPEHHAHHARGRDEHQGGHDHEHRAHHARGRDEHQGGHEHEHHAHHPRGRDEHQGSHEHERHPHHAHGRDEHQGDAHAAAHARDIERRFRGRRVTNLDIAWFGFTGGLLPCPAALAVLLICLQLKAFALGIGMVAAFSIGLALTLVGVGVAAAWGQQAASARWDGLLDRWGDRLHYISASLVFTIGLVIAARGAWELATA